MFNIFMNVSCINLSFEKLPTRCEFFCFFCGNRMSGAVPSNNISTINFTSGTRFVPSAKRRGESSGDSS